MFYINYKTSIANIIVYNISTCAENMPSISHLKKYYKYDKLFLRHDVFKLYYIELLMAYHAVFD